VTVTGSGTTLSGREPGVACEMRYSEPFVSERTNSPPGPVSRSLVVPNPLPKTIESCSSWMLPALSATRSASATGNWSDLRLLVSSNR
jgi:hypothetical protein